MSNANEIAAVQKALVAKMESIAQGAMTIAEHTSDWQLIRDYISNRIDGLKLTAKQQEKLKRYQFVYNQLSTGRYIDKEVVSQLKKQYGIEDSQAYQDLRDAKEVFNVVFNINKAFELKLTLDRNWVMMQKAAEINDLKAYAQLEKNRQKLLEMVPDVEKSLADVFQPHTFVLKFDPALIGAPEVDMAAIEAYINQRKRKGGNTKGIDEAEVVS